MPIAFCCPHCAAKIKVRDVYAGRSAPCPKCKAPLTVPAQSEQESFPAPVVLPPEQPAPPSMVVVYAPPVPMPPTPVYHIPATQEIKACPFCGEDVLAVAKKCKHCGETLDVALRAAQEAQRTADAAHRRKDRDRGSQQVVVVNNGSKGGEVAKLFLGCILLVLFIFIGVPCILGLATR